MIPFFITLIEFMSALWRALKQKEFRALFVFVVSLLGAGTFFYYEVEGWSLVDSLYFSVTTLATIGYGDLAPQTTFGKLFTIMYIFVGIGSLLGFLNMVGFQMKQKNEQ